MDYTTRFIELVNGSDATGDLAEGALLIAAHARPGLDIQAQLDRLDAIAAQCPERSVDGLRHQLFEDMGFEGNTRNYYDPENSLLDAVLDRRVGIPITLSLIVIEVGSRLGLDLDGVAMPGHFLVRHQSDTSMFIDAFNGGRVLDAQACENVFRAIAGSDAPFEPGYLDPVPNSTILSRMVANLVNAYSRAQDRKGMRWSSILRAGCPDVGAAELTQLGANLAATAAMDQAAELYERAALMSDPPARGNLRREAQRLRAQLN